MASLWFFGRADDFTCVRDGVAGEVKAEFGHLVVPVGRRQETPVAVFGRIPAQVDRPGRIVPPFRKFEYRDRIPKVGSVRRLEFAADQPFGRVVHVVMGRVFARQVYRLQPGRVRDHILRPSVRIERERIGKRDDFTVDVIRRQVGDAAPDVFEADFRPFHFAPCDRNPVLVVEHGEVGEPVLLFQAVRNGYLDRLRGHVLGRYVLDETVAQKRRNVFSRAVDTEQQRIDGVPFPESYRHGFSRTVGFARKPFERIELFVVAAGGG